LFKFNILSASARCIIILLHLVKTQYSAKCFMNCTRKFPILLSGNTLASRRPAARQAIICPCPEGLDTRKTLRYLPFCLVFLRIQEERVPAIGISIRLLLRLAAFSCSIVFLPLYAQELSGNQGQKRLPSHSEPVRESADFALMPSARDFHVGLMPAGEQGYTSLRPRSDFTSFDKSLRAFSPGTIQRMESAFYCNDTPFVDQVRLPLATFWRGRVKLVGFESDVTTANFVMGLPGQGALHNLSAFGGNGFLAVHTPPSDQLAGIHMTFSWHGSEVESGESSGLHGIEHLVHASRGFLPFFSGRSDSSSAALR
jgi:hypothetical protein